ncbi:hypothetical protein THTE_3535 [Thermogutta terrifontis]|uniref:Uncharacterized protein n=1 Tax=Thermogutta terrifontis TaxID=1331910 RepID=A0A286RJK9_9BACT|nr:hypothetical protein THTE_3535 [Thermogutta terrifontis]
MGHLTHPHFSAGDGNGDVHTGSRQLGGSRLSGPPLNVGYSVLQ